VVEAGTDEVVPGARLALRPLGGRAPVFARTDTKGQVRVEGLCPGSVEVAVVKEEHAPARMRIELWKAETRSLVELEALHGHHSHKVIVIHDEGPTSMAASESLAGADLARKRGQGLADALSGIAGVATLRGSAGGMGKPMIRGLFGRRNLILVDGVRHEGQDWGIDHAPEVDPGRADRISVIKGAGTTRFGAKAIGGVILLESRPLPRQPGVRAEVGTVGFSNPLGGGGSARIDYAPARLKGFALRVEANASRHRAAVTPTYALDNTGAATWNVGGLAGYSSDAFDLGVGYHLTRQRSGICTCLRIASPAEFQASVRRSRPIDADAYRADFEIERAKQEIWHHLATARGRFGLGNAGELHALYSFQFNDRREFDVVREGITGPQLTFGLATHAADVRYEHARVDLGAWSLVGTTGTTFAHQTNTFRAATTLIPDYQQQSWGVYDVERFIHERVELEVGARYEGMHRRTVLGERDYLSQLAGGRLDPAACEASGAGGVCQQVFHTASVTVGALTRPIARVQDLTWRVQLDSSARIPSIDEHFMNGSAPSFPILGVGDSRLGVERTWGGESTLRYGGNWVAIEAAGFGSYIDNYIYFVPQPQEGQCAPLSCTTRGPLPVFAFTPVDAAFGGGELRFDLRAPRLPLGLAGSGAFVLARDLAADAPLAYLPAPRATLAGRYYLPDTRVSAHGYFEINGTAVARQRRYQADLDFAPPPAGYVLLGAAAGVEFLAPTGEVFRLSVVGTNLLNARYRDYTSLLRYFADEPGWGVQLRFSADFDVALKKSRS